MQLPLCNACSSGAPPAILQIKQQPCMHGTFAEKAPKACPYAPDLSPPFHTALQLRVSIWLAWQTADKVVCSACKHASACSGMACKHYTVHTAHMHTLLPCAVLHTTTLVFCSCRRYWDLNHGISIEGHLLYGPSAPHMLLINTSFCTCMRVEMIYFHELTHCSSCMASMHLLLRFAFFPLNSGRVCVMFACSPCSLWFTVLSSMRCLACAVMLTIRGAPQLP